MSFYNLLNGRNDELLLTASLILGYRIDKRFPRFRDIFTGADDTDVVADLYVYTRMGGNNFNCWEDEKKEDCTCIGCTLQKIIESDPQIIHHYDDDFDSTYKTICIKFTPEQEEKRKLLFSEGFSEEDVKLLKEMFPEIKE